MRKFKSVLSEGEAATTAEEIGFFDGSDELFLLFAHKLEQAVLAKLHEQEPVVYRFLPPGTQQYMYITDNVPKIKEFEPLYSHPIPATEQEPFAWYVDSDVTFDQKMAESWKKNLFIVKPLYENPSPSIVSDKTACISESIESGGQDIELLKQALETMIRAAHPAYVQEDLLREKLIKARDIAFKALETNRLNAKERHRTAKNSLEQEVLCMVHMLEAKEWADHAGQSALGKRLEVAISTLHNELYEAQVKRSKPELARNQSCGCVVCHCENEDQCLGCGAKHCGTHEVGEIPNPVYIDHFAGVRNMAECAKCGHPAIHYLVMDNLGYPNKTPFCGDCTQEHEQLAQDTNEHEIRNFGGAYGLVAYHYEPLGATQPDHIPDVGQMAAKLDMTEAVVCGECGWTVDGTSECSACGAILAAASKYTVDK